MLKSPLAAAKTKNAISPFCDASGKKCFQPLLRRQRKKKYLCYYPHRLRDLVSPICGIFFTSFRETVLTHLAFYDLPTCMENT